MFLCVYCDTSGRGLRLRSNPHWRELAFYYSAGPFEGSPWNGRRSRNTTLDFQVFRHRTRILDWINDYDHIITRTQIKLSSLDRCKSLLFIGIHHAVVVLTVSSYHRGLRGDHQISYKFFRALGRFTLVYMESA